MNKKINVYEIPVLELLEEVLFSTTKLSEKEIEQIVLDYGNALVASHTILKEQAHGSRVSDRLQSEREE